jgi:PLP dependent protein
MCRLRESLQANLQRVNERITKAARAAGRDPASVCLVAVSKAFPAATVAAAVDVGQRLFGENYVQEAVEKMQALRADVADVPLQWHFIGPIQSNKTRAIAEHFDWVQSVDRLKVAQRLSEQRPSSAPALNLTLQVNISGEASKQGIAPEQVAALAREVVQLPRIQLRGLMAIPAPSDDPAAQREPLRQLRQLFDRLRDTGFQLDTLSMGMSADLEVAIAEGSTMVRIGTAIFGERERQPA